MTWAYTEPGYQQPHLQAIYRQQALCHINMSSSTDDLGIHGARVSAATSPGHIQATGTLSHQHVILYRWPGHTRSQGISSHISRPYTGNRHSVTSTWHPLQITWTYAEPGYQQPQYWLAIYKEQALCHVNMASSTDDLDICGTRLSAATILIGHIRHREIHRSSVLDKWKQWRTHENPYCAGPAVW